MALGAGRRNRRVVVQAATESQDSAGEPIKTWADVSAWWVNIAGERGDEQLEGDRLHVQKRYRIRGLYRSDVTERNRLVEGSVIYDILSVDPNFTDNELDIVAVARG